MSKETLLQKAQKVRLRGHTPLDISDEKIELALAWARDEVRHKQVGEVLGISQGAISHFLAVALREAIRKGVIK